MAMCWRWIHYIITPARQHHRTRQHNPQHITTSTLTHAQSPTQSSRTDILKWCWCVDVLMCWWLCCHDVLLCWCVDDCVVMMCCCVDNPDSASFLVHQYHINSFCSTILATKLMLKMRRRKTNRPLTRGLVKKMEVTSRKRKIQVLQTF
jgi:hypothetical protein